MQCIPGSNVNACRSFYGTPLVGEVSQLSCHPHAWKHAFMATRSCLKPSARLAALG